MSDEHQATDPQAQYQSDRRVNSVANGGKMLSWKNGMTLILFSIALVTATVAVMQWALIRNINQDILDVRQEILQVTNSLRSTQREVTDMDTTVKLLQANIQYQLVALNEGLLRMETALKEHMR
jgi:cell division protein FtsL